MLPIAVAFVLLISQQLDQTDACTCVPPWVEFNNDICISQGYEDCTTGDKNHTASSVADYKDKCRDLSPDGSGQPLTIASSAEFRALETYLQGIGFGYTATSPRFECSQIYATVAKVTATTSLYVIITFYTGSPVKWKLYKNDPIYTDVKKDFSVGDIILLHFKASPGDVVGVGNSQKLLIMLRSHFSGEHLTLCAMPPGACPPPGRCIVRGDPHLGQYDGRNFLFSGFCTHRLSETLPGAPEQFNVTGRFVYNKPGSTRTMIQQVLINVRNMIVEVTTDGIVMVDNVVVTATIPPQNIGSGVMLFLDPSDFPRTVVDVPGVVKVELTTPVGALRRKGHRAIITVAGKYAGLLNALCGNFNDDPTDDVNPCSGGPPADCFVDDNSCT
ncbi:uncharacterized protein LOC106156901 [Lingula anatina]|uniref:Uncharacterized protein LOC106156901 n=1 Tax=Lingula anatina TaxID=7574 RepID=A0A1S3HRW3_LINAN|nr:uncharacterized protein LOC106156901 [Lingula anatina]|eukprot:XP_013387794.1 uncharacterized protein LOC106156901 [Lingula anatina]